MNEHVELPPGYRRLGDGTVEPDETETTVVHRIFALAIGPVEIAAVLDREGYRHPRQSG